MTRSSARSAFALLVLLPVCIGADQTRDTTRPRTGTASLTGVVVTDDESSRPLRRAFVQLSIGNDPRSQRTATTDDAGGFVFDRLPSGNATVSVTKAGYVRTYHGARRPGSTIGMPVALVEGQTAEPITIRVPRGGVITGTITDPSGTSVPSITVRLQRVTIWPNGERTLTGYSSGGPMASTTDDRGMYRLFGLPAGEYVVFIQPRLSNVGALFTGTSIELRQTTDAELRWAEQQLRAGRGAPMPSAASSPAPGPAVAYATVYHPGTPDVALAAPVSVAPGRERAGIDIRMQLVATSRVSGIVVDPAGRPSGNTQVSLVPQSAAAGLLPTAAAVELGVLLGGGSARTAADGSFSIRGVQPGRYTLIARGGGTATGKPLILTGAAAVDVAGRDIEDLRVALSPGVRLTGKLVFESAKTLSSADVPPVSLQFVPTQPGGAMMILDIGPIGADGSFTEEQIPHGHYRLISTVRSWTLKSAILGGRDIADAPFEIRPGEDLTDVVITFSDAPAELTGTMYDGANRPTSDLSIVLFTTERSLWFQGSRRLKAPLRPSSDGRFTISGIPAGEYYLAALADYEPSDWYNPHFLEQVAAAAITISVKDGEKKTQDLRIGR